MTSVTALPDLLREATHELHGRAERSGVMAALIAGRLPREGYVALLRNLHALYAALEARPLPVPPLARAPALAADLATLHGRGWERLPVAPAAAAYVRRLEAAAAPALAAHAYVRYLGDLHGGQVLAAVVRRAYALPAAEGTRFYDFGDAALLPARRRALREALAALAFDDAAREAAAAEARWAFLQHVLLFEELAAGSTGTGGRPG